MQPAQAADSRRMGNGLLAESPSLQGRERAGCVARGWSDRPEPGRHAVRAGGCKDPRKRPQRALGPVCVFRGGAHCKGALSSSEPLTERKKGTVGCRDGPVLPRDPVSSITGVQTVLRERGQGRWATGTEQGVTRRGHFPARGHTTWGVSPGRSSGSELRGAAPGGLASTQEACFKNKTKPAIHAGGLQKARPVPGTQGRSPPDPPTPSQAQGGCRLPFPAQCPSGSGCRPAPLAGTGVGEPESVMVEEFPERARAEAGNWQAGRARSRLGQGSGLRQRPTRARPCPAPGEPRQAAWSDRPLPCQGFLCFALVFCALVQVAVWRFHNPSQVSTRPAPPRPAR